MISIRRADDVKLDYQEVILHSPVATETNATEIFRHWVTKSQNAFVGYINGEIACVYGLEAPSILSTSKAYMWLITTDVVDRNKFEFIRNSEMVIEEALKEYEQIYGTTHKDDRRAFKWLRWLGAIHWAHERVMVPFYITKQSFGDRRRCRTQ